MSTRTVTPAGAPRQPGDLPPWALHVPIPDELLARRQWVCWRYETRDGKRTKVPYQPLARRLRARANDPATWHTYQAAVDTSLRDGHDGVGFVVTADDPYVGVDLDHCLDPATGAVSRTAAWVVATLASYTEVTPSGDGLRVWVCGTLPGPTRKTPEAEVYATNRYFTVTGVPFGDPLPLADRQEALEAVYHLLFSDDALRGSVRQLIEDAFTPAASPDPAAEDDAAEARAALAALSDADLLAEARRAKNGAAFSRLYDTPAGAGEDASAGDLSLCSRLAFWTAKDVARMDRLFRASARMRPKWDTRHYTDGRTYGQATLERAVRQCGEVYSPPGSPRRRAVAEELESLHDLGNAERLLARHGADLRFCHSWDCWLLWDGQRWARDEKGRVLQYARQTADGLYQAAARAAQLDPSVALRFTRFAVTAHNRFRLEAMVKVAQSFPEAAVVAEELDRDPWLLNTPAGTLDLREPRLRQPDRAQLLTRLTRAAYDPLVPCPVWQRFLSEVFANNARLIAFLQRAVGYALTGSTREHALFFLYGSGANGKSTFLNTLSEALGDYAWQTSPDLLLARKDGETPLGMADLCGRRFVVANEVEEGRKLSAVTVKILTSEDPINARRLYENPFTFLPSHKVFLAGNHYPEVRDMDHGIWRRLHLVPFTVTVPPERQDKTLAERLREELPGILAWAVEGCLHWQAEGLNPPPEVRLATSAYRDSMDTVGRFITERCVAGPGLAVLAAELYAAYKDWCEQYGEPCLRMNGFARTLSDRGYGAVKPGGDAHRTGLALREDALACAADWEASPCS